jgi:lambda family phage tail tape measure protein
MKQQNAAMAGLGARSNRFAQDTKRAAETMNQYGVVASENTRRFKRFGAVGLQQVGYQVQDFAVQVQGGTSAFVALGQQGSQLLGIFGPAGALLGAFLAIGTAIANVKQQTGSLSFAFKDFWADVKPGLEPLVPIWNLIKSAVVTAGGLIVDGVNLMINSFLALSTVVGALPNAFKAGFDFVMKYARAFALDIQATVFQVQSLWQGMLDFITPGAAAGGVVNATLAEDFSEFAESYKSQAEGLRKAADDAGGALDYLSTALSDTKFIDIRDYFGRGGTGGDEDGDGAAGAGTDGDSNLEKMLREIDKRRELLNLYGQELELKKTVQEVTSQLGDEAQNMSQKEIEGLAKILMQLDTLEEEKSKYLDNVQSVADTMKNSMSDAFMSMVEGTKSFKDAMKDMARAVIKQLFDILVVQQLVGSFDVETGKGSGLVGGIMKLFTGGFANGAAFSNGKVTAFADGGVVNQPTMFPMANGAGLMGEAGPEAIMPLKRGKNGKLGVQVEGGNQGNVTVQNHFHIAANGDDSVKRIIAQEAPKIANLTQKQILDQRARGGAFKTTFG